MYINIGKNYDKIILFSTQGILNQYLCLCFRDVCDIEDGGVCT